MHIPSDFLIEHPRFTAVVSLIAAMACGLWSVSLAIETASQPNEPARLSISDAANKAYKKPGTQIWVLIDGGEWDCDTIQHSTLGDQDVTDVFLTDRTHSIVIIADFLKNYTCDEIKQQPASGYLYTMNDLRFSHVQVDYKTQLARYGLAARPLELCTYCDRGNSSLGVIVTGALTLTCLALIPVTQYAYRQRHPPLKSKDPWDQTAGPIP